jgi:hypothetical protein
VSAFHEIQRFFTVLTTAAHRPLQRSLSLPDGVLGFSGLNYVIVSTMRATCPPYPVLIDLITKITFGEVKFGKLRFAVTGTDFHRFASVTNTQTLRRIVRNVTAKCLTVGRYNFPGRWKVPVVAPSVCAPCEVCDDPRGGDILHLFSSATARALCLLVPLLYFA